MWGIICDVGVPPVEAGEGFPPGFQYLRSASTPTAAMLFKNNTNTSCSGPEYIDFVMSWVDKEISDGVLFPRNACKPYPAQFFLIAFRGILSLTHCLFLFYFLTATPFPKNFMQCVRVIYTRLFRIFAIVYYHHYAQLEESGAVSHLNTSFKHFIFFIWEYDLVSETEQEALADIIKEIKLRHATAFPNRVRTASANASFSEGV